DEGLSALDMVIVQRHILRINTLKSPYKMVAADVNADERINIADIVEMRKVVLGIYDRFPNNYSWRNIDAKYEFFSAETALQELYPMYVRVDNADHNMQLDFVGVKIGDVDGSYVSSLKEVKTRSSVQLLVADAVIDRGQIV